MKNEKIITSYDVILIVISPFIAWLLEPVKPSFTTWFYQTGYKVIIIISGSFYLLKLYLRRKLDEEFVESLYLRFLLRGSDEQGLKDWLSRYRKSNRDRTRIIEEFRKGAESEYRQKEFDIKHLNLK